jgi:PKD repeat protein
MQAIDSTTYIQGAKKHFARLVEVWMVSIILVFTLGCDLFDGNSNRTEIVPPVAVAPTAAFDISTESGKATLTVDFTDNSSNGSDTITSWQWDFGDGGSSTEQNPQYSYESAGVFDVSLTVSSADGSDTLVKPSAVTVDPADIQVKLTVVDSSGVVLPEVEFDSASFQLENTQPSGSGYQLALRPSELSGVVHVTKPGYLKQTLFFESLELNEQRIVTLIKKAEPIVFDALLGGSYSSKDGASVSIPAQSLVDANGIEVIGDVELYITPIDVSDQNEINGFPGSFYGAQQAGAENEQLFSYGVVDITFEQNGEELQLRDGEIADLNLPLYATKSFENEDLVVGDSIPVWYLDEESGIWMFESNGIVVEDPLSPNGLALSSQTTHFTAFNSDINPPGLSGAGGGGGGGGNSASYVCDLTLNILGAEIGERYQYNLVYSAAGWPPSRSTRSFIYDGSPITQKILKGFLITATVSNDEVEGSARFGCNADEVIETVTLGDQPPEFVAWSFRSVPVFTKSASDEFEISSNTVYLGGYFLGADEVVITSDALDAPLILGKGILFEHSHESTDPEILNFHSVISNDFGTEEADTEVTFIDSAPPITGYAFSYYEPAVSLTHIEWYNFQGADSIRIYALDQDPAADGILVADSTIAADSFQFDLAGEYSGFLRLEFENQYGSSALVIEISSAGCPPNTDLCGPT